MKSFNQRHLFLQVIKAAIVIICCSASASAQALAGESPATDKAVSIGEFLTHLEKENQFMGSVAVMEDGKKIFAKAYGRLGEASDQPIPANDRTKYRIGSITKTFTSTMILQLAEAGKIVVDDKLSKFFPKVENADSITIDQMLRHQSGIGSMTSDPEYLEWCYGEFSRADVMEKILAQPVQFEPGEKTEYSNSNFVLLGYIIEDLAGKTYNEVLQSKICGPLKLKDTYYGKKANADENEAISYSFKSDKWTAERETHMSIPHGAGAIVSTPSDLAKFMTALFGGKLINEKSLAGMSNVSSENGTLGQGLFSFPFHEKKAFGHGGGIDGFQSNLAYFPEEKVVMAVCANGVRYPLNDVMIGILSREFGASPELPSFKTVEVDLETIKRYAGVYETDKFPMDITIGDDGKNLTAQATGQGQISMEATSDVAFKFDAAGIRMKFVKSDSGAFDMEFKQGPAALTFSKKKDDE